MRKGETLDQELARRKAEAELPARVQSIRLRVARIACDVRIMTEALRIRNGGETNKGGERSGTLAQ